MTTTSAVQSFRDLLVWQKSIDLVVIVYRLTRNFPQGGVLWFNGANETHGGFHPQ